jgi:hypothetical protein
VQDAARRIRQPHLRLPTTHLLQILPHTRERAARTSSRNEPINNARRLRPNLRTRSPVVRIRVGGVVKLVRPDRTGSPARIVARLVVVVPRVVVGHRGHGPHIGSEHAQQVDLLLALRVWHVDHAAVPLCAADVRQADARVARCAFHDYSAQLEPGGPRNDQNNKKDECIKSVFEKKKLFFLSIERVDIPPCARSRKDRVGGETKRRTHRPSASAPSIMPSAARSFTLPPGFWNSALP